MALCYKHLFRFSSDKVKNLFEILKQYNENKSNSLKYCCIIFVERKATATVLYHILKSLHMIDEEYKFLSAEYVVGFSVKSGAAPVEGLCLAKWNKEVLARFKSGQTNCLVATNMMDEGIDIPTCSFIIRYDLPNTFREYVQSKGRARHKDSQYTILLSKTNLNYILTHKHFAAIESRLKSLLGGKTCLHPAPTETDINEQLYQHNIQPYSVINENGIKCSITALTAIQLINHYCTSIFKSKYVNLPPTWDLFRQESPEMGTTYKVSLKLPIASPLKETVFGDPMPAIYLAKRSAALKACILLHKMGELTSSLTPKIQNPMEYNNYLFPHWEDEDKSEIATVGSYKKKRQYELQFPTSFYGALPIPGKQLYLHILHAEPVYSPSNDRRSFVFHKLLSSKACYGVLSTKQMPQIPRFPIFMNVGELNVDVKVNHSSMVLSVEQIEHARIFHSTVFRQIVEVIKAFMIFDFDNRENSFLVVPVNENWQIDWEIISKYQYINYATQNAPLSFKHNDNELALVVPSYRGTSNVYIVTQIYDDLTPKSAFPTEDFYSYASYYQDKHGLTINDLEQPMLEVKPISKKINCIKPRSITSGLSKRKRADILDDFEEELVPELCHRIEFPALYWLKATTLPSILHRISQFIIAEDLRTSIIRETGLGKLERPEGWPPLNITLNGMDEPLNTVADIPFDETVKISFPESDASRPEVDVLDIETSIYPWTKGQEPPDLNRNIEQIQLIDIEYYHQFMNTEFPSDVKFMVCKGTNFMNKPNVVVPQLAVLERKDTDGPDIVQIVHALTTKMGNDVFDLERLETLGDSFLKFIVTLFLYCEFPTYTEGVLTALKGRIIGNRNLFYCGRHKQIPGRMKVDDFVPLSNFIAPAYTVFRPLRNILLQTKVPPNVLYEINIPIEESLNGQISETTKNMMQDMVMNWSATESQTGMEHYLGVQIVSDKAVADCVEAIIGVYLNTMGIESASLLLKWFGVLPNKVDVQKLLHDVSEDPKYCEGEVRFHMPWASVIENRIEYKFNNQAFLLKAFTHPSYSENTITDSYEKLEFLGDALLDFLITCYIYDTCENLSPGALTDLRSALVNNITFACLSVRYGLHTALLSYAPLLNDSICRFVKFQEARNHIIDDEVFYTLLEEEECCMAEYVDVPKVLGDLFESLIGAIYLDSGKNLKCVWDIVYSLMHKEIDEYSRNVPKQPIRALYETQSVQAYFSEAIEINNSNTVMVHLRINIAGKTKLFYGFGNNKKQAKYAAAKQALKVLRHKI